MNTEPLIDITSTETNTNKKLIYNPNTGNIHKLGPIIHEHRPPATHHVTIDPIQLLADHAEN